VCWDIDAISFNTFFFVAHQWHFISFSKGSYHIEADWAFIED